MNIALTDEYRIGIREKGAVEAWSLRIARYRMNVGVYKHHIRTITDSLLIQIIATSLVNGRTDSIAPVNLISPLKLDDEVSKFAFWNDSNLISLIGNQQDDPFIIKRIERFQKRDLDKRIKTYPMGQYPSINLNAQKELKAKLMRSSQELEREEHISFSFNFLQPAVAPVFEMETQEDILVIPKNEKPTIPLAKYLGFSAEDSQMIKTANELHIFGKPEYISKICNRVEEELESYSEL